MFLFSQQRYRWIVIYIKATSELATKVCKMEISVYVTVFFLLMYIFTQASSAVTNLFTQ